MNKKCFYEIETHTIVESTKSCFSITDAGYRSPCTCENIHHCVYVCHSETFPTGLLFLPVPCPAKPGTDQLKNGDHCSSDKYAFNIITC